MFARCFSTSTFVLLPPNLPSSPGSHCRPSRFSPPNGTWSGVAPSAIGLFSGAPLKAPLFWIPREPFKAISAQISGALRKPKWFIEVHRAQAQPTFTAETWLSLGAGHQNELPSWRNDKENRCHLLRFSG
jgi:hypothetical protein